MLPTRFRLATLALTLTALALAGCAQLAVMTAPAKSATPQRSALALQADGLFWQTLHGGRYDDIPQALNLMTAAYLQDPGDAVSAARVGWLHTWQLAERGRLAGPPSARITEHVVLARRYFQEAVALAPGEARYLGFLGSMELAEGSIHHDERLRRQGYFRLKASIDAWPEFNLFTAGYVMSGQPATSDRFQQALAWQWETMDRCAGTPISRSAPGFAAAMARSTTEGPQRVCWNSVIAPHNFEGFFLNMGDMLVKAGDWQTAQQIYANARLAPEHAQWPLKALLESRITHAQANVAAFAAGQPGQDGEPMMFQSRIACTGCHQR